MLVFTPFKKILNCTSNKDQTIELKPEYSSLQVEVNGDITTLDLSGLTSQTEYDVAVTPIRVEGAGTPMLKNAVTGLDLFFLFFFEQLQETSAKIFDLCLEFR